MIASRIGVVVLAAIYGSASAFNSRPSGRSLIGRSSLLTMEYIPEGLTKAQWKQIQEEEKAKKKLGAMGTTRFKSRSFEAWQKSGGKHLFPVDPRTTPYEERPYMQRKDGDWEGKDLEKLELKARGQGVSSKRNQLDDVYEKAKADGKLDSMSIFGGKPLPWTIKKEKPDEGPNVKGSVAKSSVKLSKEEMERLKANLAKVSKSKTSTNAGGSSDPAPKKKGLFGMF
mmetsp:Transcript_31644/g.32236  ORF Transcript_31644/g.32236 Transcript_31644/m.32236 type:complete len:227 (+) Transcript_31644:70-750(+)|eukprot:CAMPEP_0182416990 /NCGR_PEP_ID=MMETSP1167-20130531/1423_1 /TAXON_ID=2988 /ORGANISM="Mallomonas Sp, Strain CCMP3275" /LENGTH=226 /DNA_ID=CAMNT_0024590239 /DNA_START=50 /DNA_END=730 /DNA_ORIENTATION=+